jgi:NAD(P)-dependent dehydrogenase (short-subunit alcohol dehydrogenase family)
LKIAGSVALVTGANRGLGRHFAHQLLERGAAKVYATARTPAQVDIAGATVLGLDIIDPDSVAAAAAAAASDVTLLINNAGSATFQNLITGDMDQIRVEMETNYFGTLAMSRAFAPILAANGGGAILNVLSVMSWIVADVANAYAAAKAAEWSLTNATRVELARQGTLVTGLHLAAADTDMSAGRNGPKSDPADVVRAALNGLEAGRLEVLADEISARVKGALATDLDILYPHLAPSHSQ